MGGKDQAWPAGQLFPRMGFVVDVVGYGSRTTRTQQQVQVRVSSLLRLVLTDIGVPLGQTRHDTGSGDGMAVFLPADTDPTQMLPALLATVAMRLARDNHRYPDRLRIRMAVGFGLVGWGPLGFTGPAILDLSRLNDSPSSRTAALNQTTDVVVLVTHTLHQDTVRSGNLPTELAFSPVHVAVKEFSAWAWLWTPPGR